MAKRKKTRTHITLPDAPQGASKSPKSFVIKSTRGHHEGSSSSKGTRAPHHSTSLNLLVKDFRKVMEPNTASNLRERKSNRFKDFLAMAGPLGVTHIIVFSQSSNSTKVDRLKDEEIISSINLKIYKVPRGPTLTFKVLRYSLMIDILNCDKHPRSPGAEFKTEPLLIMNNFNPGPDATTEEANQLNLLTTTFRNLFPQIKVHEIQLVETRRIVLLSFNPQTRTIDFRHYLITVKPIGVSKTIRKLIEGVTLPAQQVDPDGPKAKKHKKVLDLSCVKDVAEYVLGKTRGPPSVASSGGFTGAQSEATEIEDGSQYDGMSSEGESESEGEESQRKIELPQNYLGKGNTKNAKKAIRLREIGPRMELGLIKIEQGLGSGDVLYHEFIKKSKDEDLKIKKTLREKDKLRAMRKKEQEENVKRKRLEKEAKKGAKTAKHEQAKQTAETNGASGSDADVDVEGEAEDEDGEQDGGDTDEDEGSEIDEDAELSDIFSELNHSGDGQSDDSSNSDSDGSAAESDSGSEDAAPVTSNQMRKKVKFSKQTRS